MATNSIGLNLLLQASPSQVQDLLQGLRPGVPLRGRVVDLLPLGKAIIQLQGQNLLAELPPALAGRSIQKGDILPLEVVPGQTRSATGGTQLTLRLLPQAAGVSGPSAPPPAAPSAPLGASIPPQAALERALSQAKLPVSNATLAAARILASQGLPLDPQTLQSVVQAADSLLATEQAPAPARASAGPQLNASARGSLQNFLPALRLAVQTTPAAAPRLVLQQALSLAENALQGQLPAAPSPALPASVPNDAPSLPPALQAVLDQPSPENVQALQRALAQAGEPVQAPIPQAPIPRASAPLPSPGAIKTWSEAPEALPARRESVQALLQSLDTQAATAPLTPRAVIQAASELLSSLQNPQQPVARTLVRAVQAQYPGAQPAQVLADARESLQAVIGHFEALPAGRPLAGSESVKAEIEVAGLPVPRQSLQALPRERVYEAVAWLKTRGLPPQRPLVEAAAQFLSRGQAALELAQQSAAALPDLPEGLLTWRPSLKQAFVNLERAIEHSTLRLDGPDLGKQLGEWPQASGLDLEQTLLQSLEEGPTAAGMSPSRPALPAQPSLRQALAELQHEIKEALRDPAGGAPGLAPRLERALRESGQALQSLSALPLQSQPAPSIQTVTLPLALPLQGPLNQGQLSVTWRQGQEKELNEKDPVNVAVSLNTESLGEVRVLLQVWKGAVSASLKAQDPEAVQFLKEGADELKQGFAERTPFKVRGLDFGVLPESGSPGDLDLIAPLPTAAGLNLSA